MYERLDVSKSMYEKIEYDMRKPSLEFIKKVKKEFPEIDIEMMFFN